MHQQLRTASTLRDPADDYASWVSLLKNHPGYWKRLVRRACQHAIDQCRLTQRVRDFHQEAFTILLKHGTLDFNLERTAHRDNEQYYGCMQCEVRCRTFAGERVDMCRKHGQIAEHRHWFDDTQCPECCKEFHTHGRLSQHLRTSQRCQDALRGRMDPCVPVPGLGSAVNAQQERAHNGLKVVQRGAGALTQPHPSRPYQDIDQEFYAIFGERLLDMPYADMEANLRKDVSQITIPWTRLVATLH